MSIAIDFSFTEKFICIQSEISVGLTFVNFDIEPIILDIDVDDETLGKNIREALSKSIDVLDGKERGKICDYLLSDASLENRRNISKQQSKELKQRYGYKTLKNLERDYMYVDISLSDYEYEFVPCITNRGGATGIENINDIIICNGSSDMEIGMAARRAMALCKSIYK